MHHRRSLPLVRVAVLAALLAGGAVAAPAAATDPVVVVVPGDTLSEIALKYQVTVAQLVTLNAIPDPNRIFPGQRLQLSAEPPSGPPPPSAPPAPRVHVVLAGEHLTGIARLYGTTVGAIASANGIADPSYLRVGQRLTIPGSTDATVATGAAAPLAATTAVDARSEIRTIITAEAEAQGVPVSFALAVAWQESGWQPRVVSSAGAVGVMQLMPATAEWVASSLLGGSVDLYDPRSNVRAGVRLLRHYLDRYDGDTALVLAAYFQGQTGTDRYGVYPTTQSYIASIVALESIFAN